MNVCVCSCVCVHCVLSVCVNVHVCVLVPALYCVPWVCLHTTQFPGLFGTRLCFSGTLPSSPENLMLPHLPPRVSDQSVESSLGCPVGFLLLFTVFSTQQPEIHDENPWDPAVLLLKPFCGFPVPCRGLCTHLPHEPQPWMCPLVCCG